MVRKRWKLAKAGNKISTTNNKNNTIQRCKINTLGSGFIIRCLRSTNYSIYHVISRSFWPSMFSPHFYKSMALWRKNETREHKFARTQNSGKKKKWEEWIRFRSVIHVTYVKRLHIRKCWSPSFACTFSLLIRITTIEQRCVIGDVLWSHNSIGVFFTRKTICFIWQLASLEPKSFRYEFTWCYSTLPLVDFCSIWKPINKLITFAWTYCWFIFSLLSVISSFTKMFPRRCIYGCKSGVSFKHLCEL